MDLIHESSSLSDRTIINNSKQKMKGRSVSRPLINNIQNITLFQKLRVKLRVVFCSFCRFLDFQLRVFFYILNISLYFFDTEYPVELKRNKIIINIKKIENALLGSYLILKGECMEIQKVTIKLKIL